MNGLTTFLLRRKPYRGQQRFKNLLESFGFLNWKGTQNVTPLIGNFVYHADPKHHIDRQILTCGDYEYETKKMFTELIKPGQIVLDVGANAGFHTLLFSTLVGERGHVYSFEPIVQNRLRLENNLALNQINNTTVMAMALGDKSDTLNIHIDENSPNPGAFNLYETQEANTTVKVETGDSIAQDLGLQKLHFIKMDVEGFEVFALKGLKETISNFRPIICFEFDSNYQPKSGVSNHEFFQFFKELNYNLFKPTSKGLQAFIYLSEASYSLNVFALPN